MNSESREKYILQVEDNPDDMTLTELAVRKSRISNRLVAVYDGQQALDFLFCQGQYVGRDCDDAPAVILLDLKLPLVDGLEVLRQIRADKRTHDIPVIVLTSSTEKDDQLESRRLGANSYIRKPTGLTPLIETLQQIKADWLS
jgi:two-component system, response regulator